MSSEYPTVATRLRIIGREKDRVASLMRLSGFEPVAMIEREDGNVTFDMGMIGPHKQIELLELIPRDCFAISGTLHR